MLEYRLLLKDLALNTLKYWIHHICFFLRNMQVTDTHAAQN